MVCTLPETNSSHLKMDAWKTTFLLGRHIFRCYVSSREGRYFSFSKGPFFRFQPLVFWDVFFPHRKSSKSTSFLFCFVGVGEGARREFLGSWNLMKLSSNLMLRLKVVVGVEDFVLVAKCSVFRPKLDVVIVVINAGWRGNSSKSDPDISVLKCHMYWGLDSQCFHI